MARLVTLFIRIAKEDREALEALAANRSATLSKTTASILHEALSSTKSKKQKKSE